MAELARFPLGEPIEAGQARFGTDGIRGRVGSVITPALALQLGYWCGQVLPAAGPIVIGADSRSSGPMLVAALTAGLAAAGREVWDLGLCPTPAVPGTIRAQGCAGGLMVSASHNPPQDNGIKVFGASGAKLKEDQQQAIEAGLHGEGRERSPFSGVGRVCQRPDLLAAYRDSLIASVGGARLDGCKVVLDLCWGSATACGESVFRALGADLTVLHGEADGERINLGCGSTHLEALRQAVLAERRQHGLCFRWRCRPHARRGWAAAGWWMATRSSTSGVQALMAQGQLPDQRIVATVMSNLGFEKAWQAKGGLLERTAVGDQYVHQAMEAAGRRPGRRTIGPYPVGPPWHEWRWPAHGPAGGRADPGPGGLPGPVARWQLPALSPEAGECDRARSPAPHPMAAMRPVAPCRGRGRGGDGGPWPGAGARQRHRTACCG